MLVNFFILTNQDPEDCPPMWAATDGLDPGAITGQRDHQVGPTASSRSIIPAADQPRSNGNTAASGTHTHTGDAENY